MKIADFTTPFRAHLIAKSYKSWVKEGGKVLDIGCGTGVVGDELKNILNIKITGCDRDNYLLRTIPYKHMISQSILPFKNKSFDFAMFNDVLHHTTYNNQIKLINEALRVANKVTIFELKPTLIGKLFDYILNKIHNPKMDIPFTYRSSTKWEGLFTKNNILYKKKTVPSPIYYPFSHVVYILTKSRKLLED